LVVGMFLEMKNGSNENTKQWSAAMDNHTDGPWEVYRIEPEHCPWVRSASGEHVASVDGDNNADADARLIASAPEMYALLCELLKAGNANTRAAKDLAKERLAAGFFADARAAIAKAEGK
jgi:hypothetical protein